MCCECCSLIVLCCCCLLTAGADFIRPLPVFWLGAVLALGLLARVNGLLQ